jgi:hypothetical protein
MLVITYATISCTSLLGQCTSHYLIVHPILIVLVAISNHTTHAATMSVRYLIRTTLSTDSLCLWWTEERLDYTHTQLVSLISGLQRF